MRNRLLWGGVPAALCWVAFQAQAYDFGNLDMSKVVSGGTKLAKAAGGISDAEEMRLGRDVAANFAARYGFVEDEATVRYVNLVGQALVRHCDRKKIPYHFAVLRVSEINAMAAPGGYVFITQGLLDSLQDEAELAGVLSHEISHVTRQHIVKAIRQANLIEGTEDLASATGHDMDRYGRMSDFSINLLSKGLSREDELEADKQGTWLASRTGYDPRGLKRSVETLAAKEQANFLLARFNKTHPPASARLEVMDRALKQNKGPTGNRQNPERFAKYTKGAKG